MIAGTLEAAAGYSLVAIQHWAQLVTENLYTRLANWETTFIQFNDDVPEQRTVRNWKVPTQEILGRVQNANADQTVSASEVGIVVYAACCAGYYAQLAGRITAAQEAQMLADWNTYFGW